MTQAISGGSLNKWLSAACGFFLAAVFAAVGIGAFLERRLEAVPLGLIMSFIALIGFWGTLKRLRAVRHHRPSE